MNNDNENTFQDQLLTGINPNNDGVRGKLKIFLGYADGVGKTYAMLDEAHVLERSGVEVVVGYVEPHTRPETLLLLEGLPSIPPISYENKGQRQNEFDLEEALKRKPDIILLDELAHTNKIGARNKKRYQDIEELLNAGIDVYTTVNVQHIESLNDIVENITKVPVKETIPDSVFDNAQFVKLIDIAPEELLKRFEQGKIYRSERTIAEMQSYFTKENLRLLREVALRKVAQRISLDNLNEYIKTDKTVSQRFLVCMGPSPSSAKCIRWTARTAEAFNAPWTVLYVENKDSQNLSEEQQKNIRSHFDLAARLGAQIVTLNGDDISFAVAEYAKLTGITNIVIGKSRKIKTVFNFYQRSLEDKLISRLSNTEIYIIPDNDNISEYKKSRSVKWQNKFDFSWKDTLVTLAILAAATILSYILFLLNIGDQNIIVLYIMAVLFISRFTSGYAYGFISSILGVLILDFFFVKPYYTFFATEAGYPETSFIMLITAFLTNAIMIKVKTQAKLAARREHNTEILYELNKKLLITRGLDNIIELTNGYVTSLYNRTVIFYPEDPINGKKGVIKEIPSDKKSSLLHTPDEEAVAHWVYVNKKRAGAGTDTLMAATAFYMPIISQGNVLGVLGISCIDGDNLNHDNRAFLRMIASLVAMALERQRLSDEQQRMMVESEKESMKSNLLRAISHDLRTPLTAISGASSAILENENIDKQTHDKLITDIKDDSQWLIRIVENLLSVTRINESDARVTKTPQAVEEVVSEAVSRVRGKFKTCEVKVKVPDELLFVPMDATLIEQVIINLIENAVKHSHKATQVELTVKKTEDSAIFEVSDNGDGISPLELPTLFDGYSLSKSKSSDTSRGMGIGLSICKSIIKAHGGEIEAANKEEGGALFRFILPIKA